MTVRNILLLYISRSSAKLIVIGKNLFSNESTANKLINFHFKGLYFFEKDYFNERLVSVATERSLQNSRI